MQIDPATAEIVDTGTDPAAFHFPLSVAFGRGAWDPRSEFVTNGGALFPIPGPGLGVVGIPIGIPGIH